MWITDKQFGYACIVVALLLAIAGVVYGRVVLGVMLGGSLFFFGYGLVSQVRLEEEEERESALAAARDGGSATKET